MGEAMAVKAGRQIVRTMKAELRQIRRRLDVLAARARVAQARLRGPSGTLQLRKLNVTLARAKVALGRLV
jgi:hypothetical protein